MPHWSQDYLAAGYRQGADGPKEYDCWTFFRWVQREKFGRQIPFLPSPGPVADVIRAIAAAVEDQGWRKVEEPATGDGVLLAHFRHPHHIGIYVGDLPKPAVLHCQESGPALHDFAHLDMGRWRRLGFYRYGTGT